MTVNFIKLTLRSAVLWCFLVGIFGGGVLAHSDSKHLASAPGIIRPCRNGESLIQTPGSRPGQNQREAPAGKRKSLHEYGPEDIFPEAQENENLRLERNQARQPRASHRNPLASRPTVTPAPAETLTPMVTPAQTPAESVAAVRAMALSRPRQGKNSGAHRWKLLVISALFLLSLLALVYFVTKLLRQLREDR